MKTRTRAVAGLTAGVLLLGVSVGAAYGSVNGYGRFKQGAKQLLLDSSNFTAQVQLALAVDEKPMGIYTVRYAKDGADCAYAVQEALGQSTSGHACTVLDGTATGFSQNDAYYTTWPQAPQSVITNLMNVDLDSEAQRRAVAFAETALDMVVGELKNNVVYYGDQEGLATYQVQVAQSQIPTILDAGLALLTYDRTGQPAPQAFVEYEDYFALLFSQYERQTGEVLSEEFRHNFSAGAPDQAWYDANEALLQRVSAFDTDLTNAHASALAGKEKGVLYYKADGRLANYATVPQFLEAHPEKEGEFLEYYIGGDVTLEEVTCSFQVDQENRLKTTQAHFTFSTTDAAGSQHTLAAQLSLTADRYGDTKITPLDTGGRVLRP